MSDDAVPDASQTLAAILRTMRAELAKLTAEVAKDNAGWNNEAIRTAVSSLNATTDRADAKTAALSNQKIQVENQIRIIHTAPKQVVNDRPKRRWTVKQELCHDLARIGIVLLLGFCGLLSILFRQSPLGWIAIGATDLCIVALLLSAAIRSDTTYPISKRAHDRLSELMPTKLVAPVFVGLLFVALWLGFAGLLHSSTGFDHSAPACSAHGALSQSFVTLTTLDHGDNCTLTSGMTLVVVCELGSAILFFIGVFALLINRISEF